MKLKKIELILFTWLAVAVTMCFISMDTQAGISEKMLRLHILANSDSDEDQALKLTVRDAVLEISQGRELSEELFSDMLHEAERTIHEQGYDYDVELQKVRMYFDTREYDGFALPAGYYDAIRIIIGEGEGKNWWCVIFPPLCAGVCEEELAETAEAAGLSEDEIAYITEDGTTYVMRFKIAELIGEIVNKLK